MIFRRQEYEKWFEDEVEKSLVSLDRGEFLNHDEVAQLMKRTLHPVGCDAEPTLSSEGQTLRSERSVVMQTQHDRKSKKELSS